MVVCVQYILTAKLANLAVQFGGVALTLTKLVESTCQKGLDMRQCVALQTLNP